jgi:mono/diheme cytochrome c family protein
MQPVEDTGDGVDGDSDGVVNEMTIGDQTVLVIYLAAQPRPTTRTELASLGLIDQLPAEEIQAISHGEEVFQRVGCAVCHIPETSQSLRSIILSSVSQARIHTIVMKSSQGVRIRYLRG